MKITKLHVTNFKSIKELDIINPNPFSVFVGPNGAGKSNIFDALEFAVLAFFARGFVASRAFGGIESILNFNTGELSQSIQIAGDSKNILDMTFNYGPKILENKQIEQLIIPDESQIEDRLAQKYNGLHQYVYKFHRIFLNNTLSKWLIEDDSVLKFDGSNIAKILDRILRDENKLEEILGWLQALIPEFENIKIQISSLDEGTDYEIYEKHSNKPFPKHLISDGTKNILALLTAVYQSDEPQFLCIEEPENGLHPYVIESLVRLFRTACKEKGHYIWLNTHSQTLVRQLTADEIIVVDKKEGSTRVRQFQGHDFHGLKMDDAWLTNALGGGLP